MTVKSLTVFVFCLYSLSTQADLTRAKARLAEDVSQGKPLNGGAIIVFSMG